MRRQARILIVEDREEWQRQLRKLLERKGYEVIVESNEDKIRELLTSEKADHVFDVVVLDLRLVDWGGGFEGMDLLEYTDRLVDEQATRVIILTGYGRIEHTRVAYGQHKIFDFMDKNNFDDGSEFLERVQAAVRERRSELIEPRRDRH
jgi:DNA-binding NtrC family response regulator